LLYAKVVISVSNKDLDRIFEYKIPPNLNVEIGSRVKVAFGNYKKEIEGYVVGISDVCEYDESKLKSIQAVIDDIPVFDVRTIELAKWMKDKYDTTFVSALNLIMPSGIKGREDLIKYEGFYKLKGSYEYKLKNDKQRDIVALLDENRSMTKKDIVNALNITPSSINTLYKNGVLEKVDYEKDFDPYKNVSFDEFNEITLNEEQKHVFDRLNEKLDKYSKNLIYGVTASGKTEIYMQLIKEVLDKGMEAIVLVPEISLTPQMIKRFKGRFSDDVAVMHSKLNASEKYDQWKKMKRSEVKIVVGARSALFAPFKNIGIVIIDEEQEHTYKSEKKPKYHAREVADEICKERGIPLILGSATPSIDVMESDYEIYELKNRVMGYKFPKVEIVDMRQELITGNRSIFSNQLKTAIEDRISKNEQVMIFINRRGYSNFISCRSCGYVFKCDNCDISYTYHKNRNALECHYCGKHIQAVNTCPTCGSKYVKDFGVGIEKIEHELYKQFENIKVLRMDSDTTGRKHSYTNIIKKFNNKEADVLLGTQMIAKGHDFENVTLIAIIAADMLMNFEDFRTNEKALQLMMQMIGRGGRSSKDSLAVIQTYEPENNVFKFLEKVDYSGFVKEELLYRKILKYPPYSRFVQISFFSEFEKDVIKEAFRYEKDLKKKGYKVIGPSKAVVSKINNVYRWRLFVKLENEQVDDFKIEKSALKNVEVQMDKNPINML